MYNNSLFSLLLRLCCHNTAIKLTHQQFLAPMRALYCLWADVTGRLQVSWMGCSNMRAMISPAWMPFSRWCRPYSRRYSPTRIGLQPQEAALNML